MAKSSSPSHKEKELHLRQLEIDYAALKPTTSKVLREAIQKKIALLRKDLSQS